MISKTFSLIEAGDIDAIKGMPLDPKQVDADGRSPLFIIIIRACSFNRLHIAEYLISKEFDVNTKDEADWTPLHSVCAKGYNYIVMLLLSNGANRNAINEAGSTPLHYCSSKGHLNCVELLLEDKSIKTDIQDKYGRTSLMMAAVKGNAKICEALIAKGANKSLKDLEGNMALDYAKMNGMDSLLPILSIQ